MLVRSRIREPKRDDIPIDDKTIPKGNFPRGHCSVCAYSIKTPSILTPSLTAILKVLYTLYNVHATYYM